jgi:hypothetical protein
MGLLHAVIDDVGNIAISGCSRSDGTEMQLQSLLGLLSVISRRDRYRVICSEARLNSILVPEPLVLPNPNK